MFDQFGLRHTAWAVEQTDALVQAEREQVEAAAGAAQKAALFARVDLLV